MTKNLPILNSKIIRIVSTGTLIFTYTLKTGLMNLIWSLSNIIIINIYLILLIYVLMLTYD